MMNFFAPIAAAAMIAGASPLLPALKQAPVSPSVAAPATAAQLSNSERAALLKEASKALASVKTARGRFEQYSPDGSYSTGQFAMQRPGKVRFDYDDPVPLLMVSDAMDRYAEVIFYFYFFYYYFYLLS